MKIINLGVIAALASVLASICANASTLRVENGAIKTAAGEPLVMRGFNEMFVWSNDPTGERLIPEVAQSGANTLRLVWSYKYPNTQDLVSLIDRTIAHKMVPVIECHDATGKWGEELQKCVDFWKDPVITKAIESNRQWAILNIANEAGGHDISDEDFLATYKKAITELRDWGYTVPIMIDAAIWGQDIAQLLRTALHLLEHDPLQNVIFAAHSYWSEQDSIANYELAANSAREQGVALIIGEGPSVTRVGQCENPKPLPYLEGMEILQKADIGWLNWSWGGMKNGDCDDYLYFDITRQGEFGRWTHEPGAQIVALSPNSVMQTSKRPASFYADGKVDVAGVYVYVEQTALAVDATSKYQVLLAPINAHNQSYTVVWEGDANAVELDRDTMTLTGKKVGEGELVVTTEDSSLIWRVPVTVTK
ncbi:cellulase family glycosylhydrolase [Gilvimarinus sp. SDUM040013]|uniref:Cellulase family glycosylhydrolase n=1 Tax=Gilvimarinus gilvus TaxID=3058038 RepID=A0ABU4RZI2_9GAMM|nr:cellulase family glycosylhydrolase [Gilvimarinus sp. SDUM040013]MDO3384595.1 cellulase family glycosylhydrolase [Gilvimarinus sp. SDUM040013]MDX6850069.1 cellulase family glycosylhydrolase [Gilvimarinus sp. SDUM040013]